MTDGTIPMTTSGGCQNNHGVIYTSKEILELGIPSSDPIPEPKTCKYCGKTLYHECIVLAGKALVWRLNEPQRCDCEQSKAFWVRWEKKQEEQKKAEAERQAQEERKQKIDNILSKSGIRQRFLSRTFDSFKLTSENEQAYDIAVEYVHNWDKHKANGEGLLFEGSCGTGKTHLAVAISLALIQQGVPVVCKTSIDMLSDIKQCYQKDSTVSEEEVVGVYKTVDLLTIDDLGKEQATEWSVSVLYNIINERYEAMLPTIITTNYKTSALIDRLSAKGDKETASAIVSRFVEISRRVTMAWEDYRRKR